MTHYIVKTPTRAETDKLYFFLLKYRDNDSMHIWNIGDVVNRSWPVFPAYLVEVVDKRAIYKHSLLSDREENNFEVISVDTLKLITNGGRIER